MPLVARLRSAGAIVVGKTNVPQLMLLYETDNPVYGRTNNPWDAHRGCGGSSGGEAAIIAAGGVPLGLATDLGGSIRQPAHVCGIHGLKPSGGRLTCVGSASAFVGFDAMPIQPGPMARHVEDLALAMRVLTRAIRPEPRRTGARKTEGDRIRRRAGRVARAGGCAARRFAHRLLDRRRLFSRSSGGAASGRRSGGRVTSARRRGRTV